MPFQEVNPDPFADEEHVEVAQAPAQTSLAWFSDKVHPIPLLMYLDPIFSQLLSGGL